MTGQAICPLCKQINHFSNIPHGGTAVFCTHCGGQFVPELGPYVAEVVGAPSKVPDRSGPNVLVWAGVAVGLLVIVTIGIVWAFWPDRANEPAPVAANSSQEESPAEETTPHATAPINPVTKSGKLKSLADADLTSSQSGQLAYRWDVREAIRCNFSIQTQHDQNLLILEGHTEYEVTDEPPASFARDLKLEAAASGTGFLVHPEGIMVTCAHVVNDARKITATLNGKEYRATLIGTYSDDDLAILKIEGKDFPYLRLAASAELQLAQPVRVVGFPLSSTLGESIKVTQGSLAGFVDRGPKRILQIDASINPGNSGGPIVDDKGNVVGVASAILVGEKIQKVGFGIPVNKVTQHLNARRIPIDPTMLKKDMSGPELAQQTTPAVAFLKVEYGLNDSANPPKVLRYTGSYRSYQGRVQMPEARRPLQSQTVRDSGKLLLDGRGEVLHNKSRDDKQLPMMLGPLGQIGLEMLPPDNRKSWEQTHSVMIKRTEPTNERSFGGPQYSPLHRRRLSPFTRPDNKRVVLVPGIQTIRYRIEQETDAVAKIKREYHLTTVDKKQTPPTLEIKGQGIFEFDKKLGIPKSLSFEGSYRVVKNKERVTLPVTVTCNFRVGAPAPRHLTEKVTPPSKPSTAKTAPRSPVRKITDTVKPSPASSRGPSSTKGLSKFDPDK